MRKSHSSIVRLMIIVCCVGVFSLSLPIQAGALTCESSEIQVVKLWPNSGLVGVQLRLTSGTSVVWVLCNLDTFGIGERRCYAILDQLYIAQAVNAPILFNFDDTVPDSTGNSALTCEAIKQWSSLEVYIKLANLKAPQ